MNVRKGRAHSPVAFVGDHYQGAGLRNDKFAPVMPMSAQEFLSQLSRAMAVSLIGSGGASCPVYGKRGGNFFFFVHSWNDDV
jgi:hypothetical protein